jgi:hypothetical protein
MTRARLAVVTALTAAAALLPAVTVTAPAHAAPTSKDGYTSWAVAREAVLTRTLQRRTVAFTVTANGQTLTGIRNPNGSAELTVSDGVVSREVACPSAAVCYVKSGKKWLPLPAGAVTFTHVSPLPAVAEQIEGSQSAPLYDVNGPNASIVSVAYTTAGLSMSTTSVRTTDTSYEVSTRSSAGTSVADTSVESRSEQATVPVKVKVPKKSARNPVDTTLIVTVALLSAPVPVPVPAPVTPVTPVAVAAYR